MQYSSSYLSNEDIKDAEERYLKYFIEKVDRIQEIIEKVDELQTYIENHHPFEEAAFQLAIDEAGPLAHELLTIEVLKACINSKEYNFEPYIEHLLRAIRVNSDDIIQIQKDRESSEGFTVTINFDRLGGPEEWGAASKAVREGKGFGQTRGKRKITAEDEKVGTGDDLASLIWKEKFYRVDREGKTVSKEYKGRGKEKKGAGVKDITSKYAGRYTETILDRLEFIGHDKAPFFYLIEHGNTQVNFGEGDPYPVVAPARVTEKIQSDIFYMISKLQRKYMAQLKEAFDRNFNKYFGRGGGSIFDDPEGTAEGWIIEEAPEEEAVNWLKRGRKELEEDLILWEHEYPTGKKKGLRNKRGQFVSKSSIWK